MSGPDALEFDIDTAATSERSKAFEALRQDARHFVGLSTREAERRRAEIFASLGTGELPADLWPVVREELRTSLSPIVLAGIARAVCRSKAADPEIVSLLEQAAARISRNDQYVEFPTGKVTGPPFKATQELAAAIAALRNRSENCCGSSAQPKTLLEQTTLLASVSRTIIVENQSGARFGIHDLLSGRRTLIAFFYTRCMNPAKCSLTVTRLAAIARQLEKNHASKDLLLLACSYDPDFDLGSRLEAYGRDRAFPFTDRSMMLRCVEGWNLLRDGFQLKVGYSATTVNDHAREIFLVGPDLDIQDIAPDAIAEPTFLSQPLPASEGLDIGAIGIAGCCCG